MFSSQLKTRKSKRYTYINLIILVKYSEQRVAIRYPLRVTQNIKEATKLLPYRVRLNICEANVYVWSERSVRCELLKSFKEKGNPSCHL